MKKTKIILVHDGTFHLDELLSIALIKYFYSINPKIIRTRDNSLIEFTLNTEKDSVVLDVGLKLDYKRRFDHHQSIELPAACMLIWNHIKEDLNLTTFIKLEEFIEEASLADTGQRMPSKFSISSIILGYNNFKNPNKNFKKALTIIEDIVKNIVKEDKEVNKMNQVLKEAKYHCKGKVIELPKFMSTWKSKLNGLDTPGIEHAIWIDSENQHIIQVLPKNDNTFKMHGKELIECNKADFIHKRRNFAAFTKKTDLITYINRLHRA